MEDLTQAAPRGLLARLASLRLTLACLVLLALAVLYIYDHQEEAGVTVPLVAPLSLLTVNLLAAIATNGTFRRQLPLLVFHLALVAIVVLAALGRLTYLKATAEVVTGAEYGGMASIDAGPWHWGAKDRLGFENLGFTIDYKPGMQRDRTINRVRWRDERGNRHEAEIGDQVPLVLHGYRFYTTPNKGFAALFQWRPAEGVAELGTVNFPSYPLHADNQATAWEMGGQSLQATLVIDEVVIDPAAASRFRVPAAHAVVVQAGAREARLHPGDTLLLASGQLVYLGLTTWMGYAVFYEWTIPWLLMACAVAVAALGWHFWRKFAAKPWTPD